MTDPVYLDYNATIPLDPRVMSAMEPWFVDHTGKRDQAFATVDQAREQIASLLDCEAGEVCFTTGATEANNLSMVGLREFAERTGRRHIVSTSIEHPSVLEPFKQLQRDGFEIDLVPVDASGRVEVNRIADLLRPDTLSVSVMHANHETGVLQPVSEVAELLIVQETFLHTDATQTFGKDIDELRSLDADLNSISGHKIFGPQGIGALVVRGSAAEFKLMDSLWTRGQFSGQDSVPVALAVGLGTAAAIAKKEHQTRRDHVFNVRRQFLAELENVEHSINGDAQHCQPHVLNVSFHEIDSEALMIA